MVLPEDCPPTRDPEKLIREVDAAIRLNDIQKLQKQRDALELKWWESGVVLLLFISGLGFILTIFKLIPSTNAVLFWFVFFWFLLFTLALVASVEMLIAKIRALRELYEIQTRTLEHIERELSSSKES